MNLDMWVIGFVYLKILNPQNSCTCGTYEKDLTPCSKELHPHPQLKEDAKVSACKTARVFFNVRGISFPSHKTNNDYKVIKHNLAHTLHLVKEKCNCILEEL